MVLREGRLVKPEAPELDVTGVTEGPFESVSSSAERIVSQLVISMPTTTSVRHIKRQVWLILAKDHFRKIALFATVITKSRLDPTTFLTSMTLRLFRDEEFFTLAVSFLHLRDHTITSFDLLSTLEAVCLGDRCAIEFIVGRSCQTKIIVRAMLMTLSRTMIAIAAPG